MIEQPYPEDVRPSARGHIRSFDLRQRGQRVDNLWCIGGRQECDFRLWEWEGRTPWKGTPSEDEVDKIVNLRLLPTLYQVRKPRLPPYLRQLAQVRYLAMPISLLSVLRADALPPKLRTLAFHMDHIFTDDGKSVPAWPEELILPELSALHFADGYNERWYKTGLRKKNVPALAFLSAAIGRSRRTLELISELGEVRHINLESVRDFDALFSVLPAQLEHLGLKWSRSKSSVAGVTRLRALRSFHVIDVRAEIDCRYFTELPLLEELELLSTKLTNVEALLECPSLRWLRVGDCQKPLEGPLRAAFEARGFTQFEI